MDQDRNLRVRGDLRDPALCGIGLLNAFGILDEDEDPEERRRRIEAEQAASNLGAVLGVGVGLALAVAEHRNADGDRTPDKTDDKQPTMTQTL